MENELSWTTIEAKNEVLEENEDENLILEDDTSNLGANLSMLKSLYPCQMDSYPGTQRPQLLSPNPTYRCLIQKSNF